MIEEDLLLKVYTSAIETNRLILTVRSISPYNQVLPFAQSQDITRDSVFMDIYSFDAFYKTIFGVFIEITLLCLDFTGMLDKQFKTDHYDI